MRQKMMAMQLKSKQTNKVSQGSSSNSNQTMDVKRLRTELENAREANRDLKNELSEVR